MNKSSNEHEPSTATIVYLHGLGSSGQSSTAKHMRKKLSQYHVLAPDIPVDLDEVILPFAENLL